MTTFLDGPAQGVRLSLRHAPEYLRVAQDPKGHWDALDAPDDAPDPAEALYAYIVKERLGTCHIRASKGRGGFFPIVNYMLLPIQPDDKTMRDKQLWWQFRHEEF